MAAYPHPSLIIRIAVNDRELTHELSQRLKTTFSYVGGAVVGGCEPQEVDPQAHNAITLDVKLHKPYWNADDPAAQDLWENMMRRWLKNMEYKVNSTIANSFTNDEERGFGGVAYRWVSFKFGGNVTVDFETEDGMSLPKDALDTLEQVRALMAEGALGADVARVRVTQPPAVEAAEPCDPEVETPVEPQPAETPVHAACWIVERADGSQQVFDLERGCLVDA